MKDIRIGNDIAVRWSLFIKETNEPFNLAGLSLKLYLKNMYGKKEVEGFTVQDNTIVWGFYGKDQKQLGKYSLELVTNEGDKGMLTVDACDFVNLVPCSCKSSNGKDECSIETETIVLESALDAHIGTIGGLKYATERTVYLTRIENRIAGEKVGEYEVEDVTEEQRAYNRETITLNNEVLVLEGRFVELYESSDDYRRYSSLVATNGVCVYGTITIFDTGEAVLVSDIVKFGLTFSEERALCYPEEGKELTEADKNYNKDTYELIHSGTDVTINVMGRLLTMPISLGDRFFAVTHEANSTVFIELYSDGSIKVLHDMLDFAHSSEQVIKAQLYDLMLYLMIGF